MKNKHNKKRNTAFVFEALAARHGQVVAEAADIDLSERQPVAARTVLASRMTLTAAVAMMLGFVITATVVAKTRPFKLVSAMTTTTNSNSIQDARSSFMVLAEAT